MDPLHPGGKVTTPGEWGGVTRGSPGGGDTIRGMEGRDSDGRTEELK